MFPCELTGEFDTKEYCREVCDGGSLDPRMNVYLL